MHLSEQKPDSSQLQSCNAGDGLAVDFWGVVCYAGPGVLSPGGPGCVFLGEPGSQNPPGAKPSPALDGLETDFVP